MGYPVVLVYLGFLVPKRWDWKPKYPSLTLISGRRG